MTDESRKQTGGQNKVTLTEDQARQVEVLTRHGLRMEDIAELFGIGVATFKRIAARDPMVADTLKKGREDANRKVLETAHRMAVSGKHPAMTIFWLKARMGWRETQRLEHTGPDGTPIRTQSKVDLTKLTSVQLKTIEQAIEATHAEAG